MIVNKTCCVVTTLSLSVDVAVPDLPAAELGLVNLGVKEHDAVGVGEAA